VRKLGESTGDYSYDTETTVTQEPDSYDDRQPVGESDSVLRTLLIFMAVNTLVLIAILILQINAIKR
jgi:hypothetical protein